MARAGIRLGMPTGSMTPHNWNLPAVEQAALDRLPPLTRAMALTANGEARALSAYERRLLRQHNPHEASRAMWGMNEPTLEMAPGASDDIARMFNSNGDLASPEEFLGRPLTPDYIWNDPRFQQRLELTSDLEGIRTPEQRFHIAARREMGLPDE